MDYHEYPLDTSALELAEKAGEVIQRQVKLGATISKRDNRDIVPWNSDRKVPEFGAFVGAFFISMKEDLEKLKQQLAQFRPKMAPAMFVSRQGDHISVEPDEICFITPLLNVGNMRVATLVNGQMVNDKWPIGSTLQIRGQTVLDVKSPEEADGQDGYIAYKALLWIAISKAN